MTQIGGTGAASKTSLENFNKAIKDSIREIDRVKPATKALAERLNHVNEVNGAIVDLLDRELFGPKE